MRPTLKMKKNGTVALARQSAALANQRGIQAFGKISKAQIQLHGKSVLERKEASIEIHQEIKLDATPGKKRKLGSFDDYSPEQKGCDEASNTETPQSPKKQRRPTADCKDDAAVLLHPSTSASATPRKRRSLRQTELETPTKGARSLLETLALPSSSPSSPTSSSVAENEETPPSSPEPTEAPYLRLHAPTGLPDEVQDLINLHSSFLTTLSLHYAHHGSMTPADLRNLTPGIERAWKKRKVTTDDLRRILALEQDENLACPLVLTDYGHGKICIEITDLKHPQNAQRRPLNEEALNFSFFQNLQQQWASYISTKPPNPSPVAFISSLGLVSIEPCASLSKIAPLLSKGQRRLEDLKAGAIRAQQTPLKSTTAKSVSSPRSKVKQTGARSTDLFSRLKAKQLHQSTLPLPPSTELLARKSALQRLPDIAPVLDSLAVSSNKHCDNDADAEAAKSRVTHASFTMPTVVQHLQMSLRNPIGKEEGMRCVRLLAEIVPEWVGVREVGKVVSVTVRGLGIGRDELERRIGRFTERP